MTTTFTPTYTDIQYGLINHPVEVFDIYYPKAGSFIRPSQGWPTIVMPSLSGFTASSKSNPIDTETEITHKFLSQGFAVIRALLPPVRGGASGVAEDGGTYGPRYIFNGTLIPFPAYAQPDISGNTRDLPSVAWNSEFYLSGPSSCMRLMKKVREKARDYDLDPDKLGFWGVSAAGVCGLYAMLAPDSIAVDNAALGTAGVSARPNWIGASEAFAFIPTYEQNATPPGGIFLSVKKTNVSPPGDANWESPAELLEDTQTTFQRDASPAFFGTDETAYPGITAENQARDHLIWMDYKVAHTSADLHDTAGLDTRYGIANRTAAGWATADKALDRHEPYSGYLYKSIFPGLRLVVHTQSVDADPADGGGVAEDKIQDSITGRQDDAISHAKSTMSYAPQAAQNAAKIRAQVGPLARGSRGPRVTKGFTTTEGASWTLVVKESPEGDDDCVLIENANATLKTLLVAYTKDQLTEPTSSGHKTLPAFQDSTTIRDDRISVPTSGAVWIKDNGDATDTAVTVTALESRLA